MKQIKHQQLQHCISEQTKTGAEKRIINYQETQLNKSYLSGLNSRKSQNKILFWVFFFLPLSVSLTCEIFTGLKMQGVKTYNDPPVQIEDQRLGHNAS